MLRERGEKDAEMDLLHAVDEHIGNVALLLGLELEPIDALKGIHVVV